MVTSAPDSAARRAAANPAGPAPTTTTSSLTRPHLYPRLGGNLTAPAMFASVNRDPAFEAYPHSAQRRPRLPAHRAAEHRNARHSNRRRYHGACRHRHGHAINRKREFVSHGVAWANTVRSGWRNRGAKFDRPPALRWRARW